ncbi:MAG: HAD family hydrolase [Candidatus Limivicinus sp.]|jgi:HAD superfamily hydrolase (TIGR01509 family)
MIKAAIFDADGTLLNSMSIWKTAGADYLRSLGIEAKENLSETLKTMSVYEAACWLQKNYGIKMSADEIADGINRMTENFYFHRAALKPVAALFLQTLQEKGIKMCIASETEKYLIEAALRRCSVLDFFSDIVTCSDVKAGKSSPAVYREALNCLGTEKKDTWVFEDAVHALNSAKNDGFPTVGVFDSSESGQMELRKQADIYIFDYAELLPFNRDAFNK